MIIDHGPIIIVGRKIWNERMIGWTNVVYKWFSFNHVCWWEYVHHTHLFCETTYNGKMFFYFIFIIAPQTHIQNPWTNRQTIRKVRKCYIITFIRKHFMWMVIKRDFKKATTVLPLSVYIATTLRLINIILWMRRNYWFVLDENCNIYCVNIYKNKWPKHLSDRQRVLLLVSIGE